MFGLLVGPWKPTREELRNQGAKSLVLQTWIESFLALNRVFQLWILAGRGRLAGSEFCALNLNRELFSSGLWPIVAGQLEFKMFVTFAFYYVATKS